MSFEKGFQGFLYTNIYNIYNYSLKQLYNYT